MKTKEQIDYLLDYFKTIESKELIFDEAAIISTYQKKTNNQSLAIKILSAFGGLLASLAFMGFLLIAGLYNNDVGLIGFGIAFIASAIWINKKYDKIITDTVSISIYIIGFTLLGLGLDKLEWAPNTICITFILLALVSLIITQNYILSFFAVLIINGSVLAIILSNNAQHFIHVFVSALSLLLTYCILNEAKFISTHNTLSKLYSPLRIGLVVSFLAGLILLGKKELYSVSPDFIWVSSVINLIAIIYFLTKLTQTLHITQTSQKIRIYVLSMLLLLPTALSPTISGAVLIILLSFMVNYKTGLVIGLVSFVYFVCQYYYDLNFTLLTKSILLFSSGILFIALYLFTNKKWSSHEKI